MLCDLYLYLDKDSFVTSKIKKNNRHTNPCIITLIITEDF